MMVAVPLRVESVSLARSRGWDYDRSKAARNRSVGNRSYGRALILPVAAVTSDPS